MCDINVYLMKSDREELVLENVDQVTTEGKAIRLLNIFGEERTFSGKMIYYNNSEKKMIFEAA
ncbi:RNA-binding protein [Desulfonema ishimotonii]|uniref:RNA-binding protein n=1 Tax=Desulfonema ishimotonii TaxID=45657 RepID=A0A401FTK2_9BACT|nr:CooT family nickel-binding protein [Desulfonema ishimotonii]GBC60291.1 RNA-binding protein [Desulfonema ishimotonii]